MARHLMQRQRGATLLVSLIMLVVLTLFAVSAFNLSSVNLKIIGNYQDQKSIEAAVMRAIEQVISTASAFSTAPAASCIDPNAAVPVPHALPCGPGEVTISAPRCNYFVTAKGYTKKIGEITPEDTDWEIRGSVADATSGAQAAIVQGVRIRLLPGNCPAS